MIEILMPFYGEPALLVDAVASVRAQESDDWRLVVVDNHYPDPAPGRWVSGLEDPRINYIRNDRNLGVSGNLRKCLDIATESHFVIMGADDLMHPTYIAALTKAIDVHPDAAMIQPRVALIDETGHVARPLADRIKAALAPRAGKDHVLAGEELATSLLTGNWAYTPAITWRRASLAGRSFRADMDTVLDLDLLMDVIMTGGTFVLLDETAFSYRRHRTSVSSLTARDTVRFEEESRLFAELVPRLEELGWAAAARRARLHPTSRLHALTVLPSAVIARDWLAARRLARHVTEVIAT